MGEHPQIDGYRIHRVIGHGGMSTVYLAEQVSLRRKVALKVMLAEALADEVSRARFENEARTIARLEHPNIMGIYEVGRTADGLPYYSMPYLARGHLAQRKLAGDQPKVAALVRTLLQALEYAHLRGVVHRDVKAENVLFDDADRPMLADFGIALRRGGGPRLTNAGLAVGSTAYMPPEQARGADVDRRVDIYSIGVLAWEMLTGSLPYNAGDALAMALKHLQDPIPRLPPVLRHWQPLMDRALAKRPEDRYGSAREMLDALDALERRAGRGFVPVEIPASLSASSVEAPGWRQWALPAAVVVVAAAGLGYALLSPDAPSPDIPGRTQQSATAGRAAGLPAPATDARTGVMPQLNAEQASESVAAYLANAEQQLREGRLLSPPNANAWDSLEAAWRANPAAPDGHLLTARLFDALVADSEAAMAAGDMARARIAFQRAQQLDARRGGTGIAVAQLRTRLDRALDARLQALPRGDGQAARALVADLQWLGLDTGRMRSLQARADAKGPASPKTIATTPPPRNDPEEVATVAVTRADYARFADATGRAAASCGTRLFARKRGWNTTGSDGAPVVCVSAADAQAYAAWRSGQEGRRYRLPSAGEVRAQPSTPVSGWLTLCADSACKRRMASGKSRPLDAARGYEDVGIRLVRR